MPTVMTFASLQTDLRTYLERGWTEASDPEVFDQLPRLINNAERDLATSLKVQGFIQVVQGYFTPGLEVYVKPDRWREWISTNYGSATILSTTARSSAAGVRTLFTNVPHGYVVGGNVIVSGVDNSTYNTGTGAAVITAVTQLSFSYSQGALTEGLIADTDGLVSPPMEEINLLLPRSYEYIRRYWPNPSQTADPLYYGDYNYYNFIVGPTPRRPNPFELNYYEQPPLLDDANQTNWLTDLQPNLLLFRTLVLAAPFLKNDERLQTWQGLYGEQAQAITGQEMDKIKDRTSDRDKP